MSADAQAVRAVVSGACDFVVLGEVGIPLLQSFLPDAIGLGGTAVNGPPEFRGPAGQLHRPGGL